MACTNREPRTRTARCSDCSEVRGIRLVLDNSERDRLGLAFPGDSQEKILGGS